MNRILPILFAFVYLSKSAYAQSKASPIFECDFERNTCGLVNDDHHGAKWVRKYMDLGGRRGNVMMLETGGKVKQMGRLMTPILDRQWSGVEGCLSLDLFTAGDGVTAFRVKQQDDSGVLPLLGVHTQVSKWRKYSLSVEVGDYVRFILDGHINPNLGGTTVAIDNISFTTEDCTN